MERMGVEYQRFDGKEYVSLKRYYNLLCKCKALEKENKKQKEVHNLTIESKDFFINKLIEERDYWEGKYRELDKLVMQKIGVKLD